MLVPAAAVPVLAPAYHILAVSAFLARVILEVLLAAVKPQAVEERVVLAAMPQEEIVPATVETVVWVFHFL